MIGNNSLKMNQATMNAVLKEYLNALWADFDTSLEVVSVTQDHNGFFTVEFESKKGGKNAYVNKQALLAGSQLGVEK